MNNANTADKGEGVVGVVASKEVALCVEEADVSFVLDDRFKPNCAE